MKTKMSKKKKIIIALIAVVVVFAVAKMATKGKDKTAQAPMAMTGALEQKDINETITLKAPLEGTESVEISSSIHSEVISISVKEGDKVKKGQVIATLDSQTIQDDIAATRENLELLKVQNAEKNENAQSEYENALSKLQTAKDEYAKTKSLFEAGAEAKTVLDEKSKAVENCQRAADVYNVVEGKVVNENSANKAIEIAQTELNRKMKKLDDCKIKSSINGTVTRVNVKVGRFADDTENKSPMFIIENIDKLQMRLKVSEYDIGKIQVGQKVIISADILNGETVDGVVSRLSPTGEAKDQGSQERVIPVYIDVTGKNEKLIAGITAKAEIEVAKAENTLVASSGCILEQADGTVSILRVGAENKIEIIPIEIGIESDLEAQIISDKLVAGDTIVLNPTLEMTAGTVITLPTQDKEPKAEK